LHKLNSNTNFDKLIKITLFINQFINLTFMKRKFILALSLCMMGTTMFAQPKGATEPQLLVKAPVGLMAPVWSPTGDKIAVTADNYSGIFVVNADGSNMTTVSTEAGAGYKMVWSADGKQILGRTNVVENTKVLHEVKVWNVANGKSTTLVAKTRDLKGTPTWNSANTVTIANNLGIRSINTATATSDKQASVNVYEMMASDPVGCAAKISALKQYAGKVIINPALSPDGSKVAFQVPGHGLFVCDNNGKNLVSLGKASNPTWLPDNLHVIATRVQDNGHSYTASQIYSFNVVTGAETLVCNNANYIPMRPSVSPDGQKLVFENAADASIYIVNLKY
jgi:Tol biopolymer transport system component